MHISKKKKVKKEIEKQNGSPFTDDLAWNLDESGVDQLTSMKEKVVVLKIRRVAYVNSSSDRTHLSTLGCIGGLDPLVNQMIS